MDRQLQEKARALFEANNGFCTSSVLHALFTDEQLDYLTEEGFIELTAEQDVWAWKM